ncbi:hypothetical protein PF002_g2036 [Phytophthora fragariae]|uniref:Bromo domain-containing protein n=1 Tax=Phytophthora fragariae TaxID=53985 RepID=A0A6A4AGM7_9STRA|nr:hypothetical protein PF002_g2036 [Phytophthora fragariae]
MSSSSSSGYSDEDTEASAPSAAAPPSASELGHVVELAQICSFCSTFRQPLRLPSFTRTELQEAILGASSGDTTHLELLAELHFKLAREHPTAKMEKMVQDWEKTLARKLQENWGKEFTANPMAGGVTYRELTVFQRVKILDALCHWKLDTCAEIHKHIATLQKENDNEAIKRLRAGEIGTDDNGVSYWYFDDGCWIYAENKPRWQRQERKPSYLVEFASAKRIRLSINFDPDHNSSAPPLRLPLKSVAFVDEIKEHKAKDEVKMPDENATSEALKVEAITVEMVKQEPKAETSSTTTVDETITSMDNPPMNVKEEQPPHASNGSVEKQEDGSCFKPPASQDKSPQSSTQEGDPASSSQDNNVNNSGKTPQTDVSEDNSGGHVQPCVVAVVGSKKRAIIDDDSSESNGVDTAGKTSSKQGEHPASPPPRKKRKASVENCNIEATVEAGKYSGDSTKPGSPKVNESAVPEASKAEPVASDRKEAESLAPKSQTSEIDVRDVNSSEATLSAAGKETSTSLKEENEATPKGDNDGIGSDQEKLDEQRRKQQELAWNILPRRQSSRIAIGRMKNQSVQDSDAEDGYSEDDVENRRPGLRSRRSHSDGVDGQQKNDRAWRAQRRHQVSDDDMDLDDDDDDLEGSGVPGPGNWINWPLVKGNARCLSTVCLAFVNRLLKEEASDLFSRPVDPELDGCPNYLSVIDHPMDLGTIRSRVEASFYRKWELFKKDVELVWQNCRTFNAPDTMVVQFADLLSQLSRSMCNAAEKNGVIRMKDKGSGGDESEGSLSDASKAESHSSVNKAWTESSASESSDSSNGGPSSDGDSDSDGTRKRRSARTSSKKPRTRSGSTKSRRTSSSPANKRASRSTRSRSSKKRPAPTSSSEDESSASEDEVVSPVRKSRRPLRGSGKPERKVDPPTEEEDSSADDSANNIPPPPHNGAPSPSPPPPPPPSQSVQNRPKPRLIISDSSSSDDSSGSDGNSSSSSSSDSDGSDSDSRPSSKKPQPPPPSSAVPAPPPPTPPPPAASPDDSKPHVRPSPSNKTRPKAAAEKKVKLASAGKTTSGYTHSPPLLNSYLSPSSSSSSDLSSDDSESSDSDSD